MFEFIDVNKIEPHPHNPRKDLGDLSELVESIKVSGILQNLTVVPWYSEITGVGCDDPKQQEEMGYIVIIGHRRLAAAKLAGLTEVPCSISNMDKKAQIATMLLENMQRSDLTVYEQAQGFQMMLDLGETVTNISEKTGFSKSTVHRRVKLLELDSEKFKESTGRGATLMDYAELEKIEDIKLRNKVLDKIGTANFKYELQSAIDQEKKDKVIALLTEQLDTFATKIEKWYQGLCFVCSYYGFNCDIVEKPDDTGAVKYFYTVSHNCITLYKEKEIEEVEEDISRKEHEEQRKIQYAALEEITKRVYELRCNFVRNVSNAKAKKNIGIISENAIYVLIEGGFGVDYDELAEMFNIEVNDEEGFEFDDIADKFCEQPELCLLVATYIGLDCSNMKYFTWDCEYKTNEELDRVYGLLEKLGYEMSDEEVALRDGIHELFESMK